MITQYKIFASKLDEERKKIELHILDRLLWEEECRETRKEIREKIDFILSLPTNGLSNNE